MPSITPSAASSGEGPGHGQVVELLWGVQLDINVVVAGAFLCLVVPPEVVVVVLPEVVGVEQRLRQEAIEEAGRDELLLRATEVLGDHLVAQQHAARSVARADVLRVPSGVAEERRHRHHSAAGRGGSAPGACSGSRC